MREISQIAPLRDDIADLRDILAVVAVEEPAYLQRKAAWSAPLAGERQSGSYDNSRHHQRDNKVADLLHHGNKQRPTTIAYEYDGRNDRQRRHD